MSSTPSKHTRSQASLTPPQSWLQSTPWSGHPVTDAESFLQTQIPFTPPTAFLVCTWGQGGAAAVRKFPHGRPVTDKAIAWRPFPDEKEYSIDAVDTVGAGDTFIAGMLYA